MREITISGIVPTHITANSGRIFFHVGDVGNYTVGDYEIDSQTAIGMIERSDIIIAEICFGDLSITIYKNIGYCSYDGLNNDASIFSDSHDLVKLLNKVEIREPSDPLVGWVFSKSHDCICDKIAISKEGHLGFAFDSEAQLMQWKMSQ